MRTLFRILFTGLTDGKEFTGTRMNLMRVGHKIRLIKALFSTDAEAMGLYNKPMASNSQIWNHKFDLLLDGPTAKRNKIMEIEKILANGGLFGYRFFYPRCEWGNMIFIFTDHL